MHLDPYPEKPSGTSLFGVIRLSNITGTLGHVRHIALSCICMAALYVAYVVSAYLVATAVTVKNGVGQAATGVSFFAAGAMVFIVADHVLAALRWVPHLLPFAGWLLGLATPVPAIAAAPALFAASEWDYRIFAAFGALIASTFSCFNSGE